MARPIAPLVSHLESSARGRAEKTAGRGPRSGIIRPHVRSRLVLTSELFAMSFDDYAGPWIQMCTKVKVFD